MHKTILALKFHLSCDVFIARQSKMTKNYFTLSTAISVLHLNFLGYFCFGNFYDFNKKIICKQFSPVILITDVRIYK